MLTVERLDVFYGRVQALRGVVLRVAPGELVTIVGPNGAGKTTLLRAIMGVVPSRAGTVAFEGETLTGRPPETVVRRGLALVPEGRELFGALTVRENLILGMKSTRQQGRWSFDDVFALFPVLRERIDTPGGVLSGGEQQMLTICRTLMGDPELIMIDEPTEGLAPKMVELVADLLEQIAGRGVSILLVEQKLTIALRVSHRLYVMGHGRIVFEGTPGSLRENAAVRKEWLEV